MKPLAAFALALTCAACGGKPAGTTIPDTADFDMQASDFDCILKWTPVNAYRITNKLTYLSEALAAAKSSSGGTFPPGTVIQLVPNEAMVKRHHGWNPATHDWEFFALQPNLDGTTTITARGGAEVVNHFNGGSCFNCHDQAKPQWDLICGTTHGCTALPFGQDFINSVQMADPRCSQ